MTAESHLVCILGISAYNHDSAACDHSFRLIQRADGSRSSSAAACPRKYVLGSQVRPAAGKGTV